MVLIKFGGNTRNKDGREGEQSKNLDDIIREDIQQMDDTQREYFYEKGLLKYGELLWEKKVLEMDYYELNKELELDATDYSINDLFDLLDLEKNDSKIDDIDPSIVLMKKTLDESVSPDNRKTIEKYKTFFDAVAVRLKKFIDEGKTETSDNLIQKQDISKIKRTIIPCAQKIIVNSDIDVSTIPTSTICPDGSVKYNVNRYQKTNFEVFLEFKLTNTSKLTLGNVIIPLSGYFPIDSAYNTNTFTIKDISTNDIKCIELEPQQPKQSGEGIEAYAGFIVSFEESLKSVGIKDVSLTIGKKSGIFVLSTDSIEGYEIDWLGGDCDAIPCVGGKSNLTTKNRPTSTLGYLMGFKTDDENEGKFTIKKNNNLKAFRHSSDMIGSHMFYLQITDYTGSTKNHNKVNISKPIQTFKQSYYFNSIKSRIGIDNSLNFCEKMKETNKRSSRKGTSSNTDINFLNQLTNAQKETIKAIEARRQKAIETESSPSGGVPSSNGDVLTAGNGNVITIPIPANKDRGGPPGKLVHPIRFSGSKENICPILFSGSTDIIKLGIALLDQNEFLVDLHGAGIIVTFNTDQEQTSIV